MIDPKLPGAVHVHLLDSTLGHPVQTWQFVGRVGLSVGRADDADVRTSDSRVSRQHAELRFDDGAWTIESLGRNGVLIDGTAVAQARLVDKTVFQLGSGGPSFQFSIADSARNSRHGCETLENIESFALEFLELDERQKEEEVRRIVEDESFRHIQEQLRGLKRKRDENSPES